MNTPNASSRAYVRSYYGQVWYNVMGDIIDQTGNEQKRIAVDRINAMEQAMRGKWCFALVKIMRQLEHGKEEWTNTLVFPDGTTRSLVAGELAMANAEEAPKGHWITIELLKSLLPKASHQEGLDIARVRAAASTSIPYGDNQMLRLTHHRFSSIAEFQQWLATSTNPVYIHSVRANARQPDEEGYHAYLVVAPN